MLARPLVRSFSPEEDPKKGEKERVYTVGSSFLWRPQ
jgi:hypothetical protein